MTQKEKLIKADMLAMRIKNIATRLEQDSASYDIRFPMSYARELREKADEFLKLR